MLDNCTCWRPSVLSDIPGTAISKERIRGDRHSYCTLYNFFFITVLPAFPKYCNAHKDLCYFSMEF